MNGKCSAVLFCTLMLGTAAFGQQTFQSQQIQQYGQCDPQISSTPCPSTATWPQQQPIQMQQMTTVVPQACQEMISRWEQDMTNLRQTDQRLQQALTQMQTETGQQKLDAIVSAIRDLATNQRLAISRLEEVHQRNLALMQDRITAPQSGVAQTRWTDCPRVVSQPQTGYGQ
jgi:hypothetical protein